MLDLALEADADFLAALSDDAERACTWIDAFAAVSQTRGSAAGHTQAKQLYWLTGEDAGGSLTPALSRRRHCTAPSLAPLAAGDAGDDAFRELRQHWLPGFALVSRDDLLNERLAQLREQQPDATQLEGAALALAWCWRKRAVHCVLLHASFNATLWWASAATP